MKTRLARTVGDPRALCLYQWLGERVVRGLLAEPRGYDVQVACTPDGAVEAVRRWLPHTDGLFPQGDGDLGARMEHAVRRSFSLGYRASVLVGTDCAAVDHGRVTEALAALRDHDAVLGPARDGGYYLLGLSRPLAVFQGPAWSSAAVAEDTRALLRCAGARWAELATETDVDTEADLEGLRALADFPR
ncbi:MAG: TIGR04282 family arsenosugar biosynthesis glycosyltransferase [Deltaproteobacteria bacterium]|nr:TIGR04282 family arsenosugar biosynthesis glycosyltransferase [Deltaproteobacteria bacterium]